MSIKFLLIPLLFLIASAQAIEETAQKAAQEKTETDYFAIVNETGGYVNKELHQEFWAMLAKKYDEKQREKIVSDVLSALEVLKAFQTKTWESAKQSYYGKGMLWVEGFTQEKERLLKQQSPYFSAQNIIDNAYRIVHASANRHPIDLGAGKFYMTPELIEENLIGMQGSYERLKILLTPQWHEEYKEYVLPKIQLTILSMFAPDEYEENVTQDDETLNLHIAQLTADKHSVYEVGAVEYHKQDKKFSDFSQEEKEIYMQEFLKQQFAGYKVSSPSLSKGNWRGYDFIKGSSSYQNYHIIVMSLFIDDKALYIKHVTDADLSLASANFNDFTKRIQLLEKT